MLSDHAGDALKVTPPAVVTITSWIGMPLQEWVYVITLIYTSLLLIRAIPKTCVCVSCFVRHKSCDRKCKI
jgi:hypothetical protein